MPGPRFDGHGGPPPGFGGPMRNRPFPHFDYRIPSMPKQSLPVGTSMVETFTYMQTGASEKIKIAQLKKDSKVKGFFTGLRVIFSGGLRNQVYQGRMSLIEMQLKENRITKRQAIKRKMDAAKKYNRYLLKIGYITGEEYVSSMEKLAESLGARYIDDQNIRSR